jgi:hypothetical protein
MIVSQSIKSSGYSLTKTDFPVPGAQNIMNEDIIVEIENEE